MTAFSVILLNFSTNPAAVIWRIWALIVNAVNGHILFWYTHICDKIIKGMPSITNSDTSTAIVRPAFMVRAIATLVHSLPSVVKVSLVVRNYLSLLPYSLGRVMFRTTTTSTVARNKMPSNDSTDVPAIAYTSPTPSFIRPLSNISDCNQLTKTLSTYINTFSHIFTIPPKIRYVNLFYFNTNEDGGWS